MKSTTETNEGKVGFCAWLSAFPLHHRPKESIGLRLVGQQVQERGLRTRRNMDALASQYF